MNRETILGIIVAVVTALVTSIVLWVFGTFEAGLDAADEAKIKEVIEESRVITEQEVDQIKGDISTIRGTLDQSLQVQEALLNAILNDE